MSAMNVDTAATEDPQLLCKKLTPRAKIPCRSRIEDAGYDMFACFRDDQQSNFSLQHDERVRWEMDSIESKNLTAVIVPPGARVAIPTGVAVACPSNTVFQVWPRSGWALKKGLDVLAGVVDSGYRNEVVAILVNHGSENVRINQGDKVCQMLPVYLVYNPELRLHQVSELPPSERGLGGFGSSGNR